MFFGCSGHLKVDISGPSLRMPLGPAAETPKMPIKTSIIRARKPVTWSGGWETMGTLQTSRHCCSRKEVLFLVLVSNYIVREVVAHADTWVARQCGMTKLENGIEPFRFLKITGLESLPFGYVGIIDKYMTSGQERFSCFLRFRKGNCPS